MISKTSDIKNQVRDQFFQLVEGIEHLSKTESLLKHKFPIKLISHSRKLTEIIKNPLIYLGDKVGESTCTTIDQIVDKIKDNSRSRSILNTTISANIRSIYEAWVLCNLINKIGTRLIYPNNGILYLGKYKVNKINDHVAIVDTILDQKLAFFLETSIPSKNNVNPKSGGLRPDIVILPIKKDIFENQTLQPVIKFSYDTLFSIVECKESTSWPWTKKYIYNPLNNNPKKINVTHLEMLKYYSKVYNLNNFFVVSRLTTPKKACEILKTEKITLFDEVGFNHKRLDQCVKSIETRGYKI